jgi:hypothetical protein
MRADVTTIVQQGRWWALAVASLQGAQYALFGVKNVLLEPGTTWKTVSLAAGLLPLVLLLAMFWRGNLFVRRALLLGHVAVVLTMLLGVVLLLLLPATLNQREQTRVWLLLGLGALSAFICVGMVRPSTKAFLEQQRAPAPNPPASPEQPAAPLLNQTSSPRP